MKKETTTIEIDESALPPVDESVPRFMHCLIDKNAPTLTIEIGDAWFKTRAITAGENAGILASCRLPVVYKEEDGVKIPMIEYDNERVMVLTVAAALGSKKKISGEGWSLAAPITDETVADLERNVLVAIYLAHNEFFRADKFGVKKS